MNKIIESWDGLSKKATLKNTNNKRILFIFDKIDYQTEFDFFY
jgi:hypothetical protein